MLSHRLLQRTVVVLVPLLCLCIQALPAPAAEMTTKPPIANAVIDPDRLRTPAGN